MNEFLVYYIPIAIIVVACLFGAIGIIKIILKSRDKKAKKAFEAAEREKLINGYRSDT